MHKEPTIINGYFVAKYGEGKGMDQIEWLHKQNEIAKRLISTDYKHLVMALEKRAKETHERELKGWGLGLEDIGQAEDVQLWVSLFSIGPLPLMLFCSTCDTLMSAVRPLLNLIGSYLGCYITLIAAAIDDANDTLYFSASVGSGVLITITNSPVVVFITSQKTRECESTGPNSTSRDSRAGLLVHSSSISVGLVHHSAF